MTLSLRQLGIEPDASHTKVAEHVYSFLRKQSPHHYPLPWATAPEPLRLAITLAVITGADHASALLTAGLNRKLDAVGTR